MITKVTNSTTEKTVESIDTKQIATLNVLLYILIGFIGIYVLTLIYNMQVKTDVIQQTQDSIRTVVMLPSNLQIGGLRNESDMALITTNIIKEPLKVKIDNKTFISEKSYDKGDIVLIKNFNVYGIVVDRSKFNLNDCYHVMCRDNNHQIYFIDVPVDFLLKPSAESLTPFILTP